MVSSRPPPLTTPDGRYIVVAGRLWRATRPDLDVATRGRLVRELMRARRAVRAAGDDASRMARARRAVHQAKVALGERGPPWWKDGAPSYGQRRVENTPYAGWFQSMEKKLRKGGWLR